MEIPIFEAKMAELITLVTNYSCGEDSCVPESGSFPLEWAEYREPGTQFIKASTYPSSIAKQLKKVWKMDVNKRQEFGKKAKKWTIDNYSSEVIGKKLEKILDDMPDVDYDFITEEEKPQIDLKNDLPDGKKIAVIIPKSERDVLWVNSLIENLKKLYSEYKIFAFTMPEYFPYIEDNKHIEKVFPYTADIDDTLLLEGSSGRESFFDIAFAPHTNTQKFINFTHNGIDKNEFQLIKS
jgi:hypothetical protein